MSILQLRSGQDAKTSKKPNIIVIVIDDVKASHLPIWGYAKNTTPWLKRNRKLFTIYQWAMASSNWSGPSHASIFTGKYPSEHGVLETGDGIKKEEETIATVCHQKGYHTLAVSPCPHVIPQTNFDLGIDEFIVAYEHYRDWQDIDNLRALWYELISGFEFRTYYSLLKLKQFIDRVSSDPFFAFVNFNTAHAPYCPPKPFNKKFKIKTEENVDVERLRALTGNRDLYQAIKRRLGLKSRSVFNAKMRYGYYEGVVPEINHDERLVLQSWYDGSIAYLDMRIGQLCEYLMKKGLFEQTAIFILSDHGESFGEKRMLFHSMFLYNNLLHVPLMVKYPRSRGVDFTQYAENVSLNDLLPTIKGLLGDKVKHDLRDPAHHRVIYAEESVKILAQYRKFFPGSKRLSLYEGAKKTVIEDNFKYIWYENGQEELFDFKHDYEELHNLSDTHQSKLKQMRKLLGDTTSLVIGREKREIEKTLSEINL